MKITQLGIFESTNKTLGREPEVDNSEEQLYANIKSVSDSQHKIIYNICQLYLNGNTQFDIDLTYSKGNFYGTFGIKKENGEIDYISLKQPKIKCDVFPQQDDIIEIPAWDMLPFDDGTFNSVMFDPPFVVQPKDSKSIIEKKEGANKTFYRFHSYYPISELLESYKHFIFEGYRILQDGGIFVFKNQPTVTGGRQLNSHHWIWLMAECAGFDVVDEFVLIAKNRMMGKEKNAKQQHARKFHSYFYVLKKDTKKKVPLLKSFDDSETLMKMFIEKNR